MPAMRYPDPQRGEGSASRRPSSARCSRKPSCRIAGIGFLVIQAYSTFNMPLLYSLLIALFAMAIALKATLIGSTGRCRKPRRETEMIRSYAKTLTFGLALCLPLAAAPLPANAQAKFKVVIGNIINWENQGLQLGIDAGIYRSTAVELENVGSRRRRRDHAGRHLRRAPILAARSPMAGPRSRLRARRAGPHPAADVHRRNTYWYVKADSPLKSSEGCDRGEYDLRISTSGSTTDLDRERLLPRARRQGEAGQDRRHRWRRFPQVMSGQVDIGWAAPPFGLQEIAEGKIRIIGRGGRPCRRCAARRCESSWSTSPC